MFDVLYIFSIALTLFGVSSLSIVKYRTASFLIVFWNVIIFTMRDIVYDISAAGSLFGIFFILFISMMMTLIFTVFYQAEQNKILLRLSIASSLLSATHLLFIMTYIKLIRELWWYNTPIFDFFYWNYANVQIVLTLYMISLFWKSGIMGLSNGLDKIFRHNSTRKYINSLINFHGVVVINCDSNCDRSTQKNKVHKKGIR